MKKILLLLTVLLTAALLLNSCEEQLLQPTVTIMVAEGEGYTVVGENPRKVKAGEPLTIQLELESGWMLIHENGTLAKKAEITLDPVLYPKTIHPDVREWARFGTLLVRNSGEQGTVTTSSPEGELVYGTVVTVTAQPLEGYVFSEWMDETKNQVLSKNAEYTFTMDRDMKLVPSYITTEEAEQLAAQGSGTATLIYNANGGICTLEGQVNGIYYEEVDVSQYKLPNCMGGLGQFVREGYQLVEYNTKPDGTGDAYSLGSKIILNTGLMKKDSELLYCIWKKETDASAFTYTETDGELTITGYSGNYEEVIIPARIDGKPVTKLAKNALVGCSFTLLSLPDTMTLVERDAIVNCENFTTLYFPDSIISINDRSIRDCPNWQHFYLNAVIPPRYGPGMLTKTEAVITTQDKNRVVVLSGSSSLHGLDSDLLSAALDDQYYVVNHGTNAGCTATVYLDWFQHYMHEGDILVQAPEHSNEQLGSVAVSWKTYRELEMFYNVFRYLDAREYTFFAGFQEHQRTRISMKTISYNTSRRSYTEHGDIISSGKRLELNSPSYHGGSTFSYSTKTITDAFAKALNDRHDALREKGVTVYMSFAPHNYNALTKQSREASHKEAYTQFFRDTFTSPVISYLGDYTLKGEYMYDSDWHANDAGRQIRTEQLGKDLRAQLIKDGFLK